MAQTPRLWTHRETAEFLSISATQLYALNREGDGPPSFKIGKLRRYDPADVRAWLGSHCKEGVKA
ncbi:helix-turn-helix transcriptional regulator [Polymorphospora rubra]|nr:helix-turn-helix domain-containing protein [Polymorphospora rubra]